MKILIIQLARLGDLYMCWPTARALHRQNNLAKIDFLCRAKFSSALDRLEVLNKKITFPSEDVITQAINNGHDLDKICQPIQDLLQTLELEKYDRVYNLTFSSLSSLIAYNLELNGAEVFGYSRYHDGTLKITDPVSSYFFSHVGINKENRIHLTDIFSDLCGCHVQKNDWFLKYSKPGSAPNRYIAIHIGASNKHKNLSASAWSHLLTLFLELQKKSYAVVLLGSSGEESFVQNILSGMMDTSLVLNLVGQTSIHELEDWIGNAQLLIGCDSVCIHIASLTQTPTICLSVGPVNFWETGPKADRSWIFRFDQESEINGIGLVQKWLAILNNENVTDVITKTDTGIESYTAPALYLSDFGWAFIKAIHLGHAWPVLKSFSTYRQLEKFNEVNEIILNTLLCLKKWSNTEKSIIETADELLVNIGKHKDFIIPLFDYYQSLRVQIPPGPIEDLIENYILIHSQLKNILSHYILNEAKEGVQDGKI